MELRALLIGFLGWVLYPQIQGAAAGITAAIALNESISPGAQVLVLGSFGVLAGLPIFEELMRSLRSRRGAPRARIPNAATHGASRAASGG